MTAMKSFSFAVRVVAAAALLFALAVNSVALAGSWQAVSGIRLVPENAAGQAKQTSSVGFVFADSDTRLLEASEAELLDDCALTIAINEMYARRGLVFNDPDLSSYFESKSWYMPSRTFSDFEENSPFNEIEQQNLDMLAAERDRRGL